jgi:hypothetical protein
MKKIITLLFCLCVFATSFAQYHWQNDDRIYRENRQDDHYANSSYGDHYYDRDDRRHGHFNIQFVFSAGDRNFQIERINRDFDHKVEAIQCDPYMRHHEKREAIRNIEYERTRQIDLVNERFNCNR